MYPRTEAEARDKMRKMLPFLKAIIFHIKSIEATDNPEDIKIHIKAIDEINANPQNPFYCPDRKTTAQSIREGSGDFARIKDKCIKLGVV